MIFTDEQKKIIYNAVREYQTNKVGYLTGSYHLCEEILNSIFPEDKDKK